MTPPATEIQTEATASGFLMRNFLDLHKTLQEQSRFLAQQGRIVLLDTK